MLECRPNVSFCHLPLAFSGFVANDGGYLDAHELLLAPRRQLLDVTRGLTVPPWLLLRRHHNPRDVNIRPCGGYGGDLNVGASAELLPGLEGRVLRALLVILGPDLHVGAGVLVDFAEGRVERDERKEDVAEGGVLQEGHFLRQRVSPRRKAHLDLMIPPQDMPSSFRVIGSREGDVHYLKELGSG